MNTTAMSNIVWPNNAASAVKHYVGFVVKIIEENSIDYSTLPENPLPAAKLYLDDKITDKDMADAGQGWREYIDQCGYSGDFQTLNAVKARLAWSAFSVNVDNINNLENIWENLSWVIEFCNILTNSKKAREIYRSYFFFKD